MKFLLLSLLLLVGCCPVASAPPQLVTPEQLTESVVALVETDESGVQAYCSGTWVSPTHILTAKHCLGRQENGHVTYVSKADVFDGIQERVTMGHTANIVALDEEHDLALLTAVFTMPLHTFARISTETVYQGEFVQTLGAPQGLMFSYSHGDVAAIRLHPAVGREDKMVFIQTTAPISPGNSGGGLFNGSGELIGVAHASFSGRAQGLNLFIHYQYADALLRGSR